MNIKGEGGVLVVSPHCDDAEFGCGGTIAKYTKNKVPVTVIIVAVGREADDGLSRINEFKASMGVLGVTSTGILFPGYDARLNEVPSWKLVGAIERAISEYNTEKLFIPLPSFHQDHKVVWDASLAAVRPNKVYPHLTDVLGYEYPLTVWGDGAQYQSGGLYYRIDDTMRLKMKALQQYKSQMSKDGMLSLRSVRALAARRGAEAFTKYAEFFHVLRKII
ncbi:MAG: hypothetical protein GWN00_01155 [Aliifodinibius sp.]|nr:hypothetical protein [Fodinibius sp.]NIV09939.1 hypothetical protein [Fodinibius sp.]NIY23469.1 hypothetical protein [Fodinibius sp.]